jgi:hypothetical protein
MEHVAVKSKYVYKVLKIRVLKLEMKFVCIYRLWWSIAWQEMFKINLFWDVTPCSLVDFSAKVLPPSSGWKYDAESDTVS